VRLALALSLAVFPASVRAAGVAPVRSGTAAGLGEAQRKRALSLADLLILERRLEEAERWVREQMAKDIDDGSWTLRLARILGSRLNHASAMRLYQKLLETRADDPGLLMELGRQSAAAGEFAVAEKAFLKAREIDGSPAVTAHLSDLASRRGKTLEARRWAKSALEDMGEPRGVEESLLHLRLRARLGWEDAFDGDYARLYRANPREGAVLSDWAGRMIDGGYPDAAREPLRLLREGFPVMTNQWRRLEASRLRAVDADVELEAHLRESMAAVPEEPAFPYLMGDLLRRQKCWGCAEVFLSSASRHPNYERSTHEALHDVREEGSHWIGPVLRWNDSQSSDYFEEGLTYRGLPRPHWRARAEAASGRYRRKSGAAKGMVTGLWGSLARERRRWTAGVDADLRISDDFSAFSPGAFGSWDPNDRWSFTLDAWGRRLWRTSASALVAGIVTDEIAGNAKWKAFDRLRLGLDGRATRLSARAGGRGKQFLIVPEASAILMKNPVYLGLSYRFVHLNAESDAVFSRTLSLTPRVRSHYGILSAGKRWLDGHLRTDGYVYSAEESGRGRRFLKGNLVGFGLNADYFLGERWKLSASYSQSREDFDGTGDRSQKIEAALEWRWGGGSCPPEGDHDG